MELSPQLLVFFMMAATMILSALMVVFARNPIHSVLFLILAFLNAAGLFILQGAEFVALILAIVYVGAVAILFLFVVMMFDIDFKALRSNKSSYMLAGSAAVLLLLMEVMVSVWAWQTSDKVADLSSAQNLTKISNTQALGNILYTDYFLVFQLAGMVLLVAMIGAIVLTLKSKSTMRHQDVDKQLSRTPDNTLRMVKVRFRKGVKV